MAALKIVPLPVVSEHSPEEERKRASEIHLRLQREAALLARFSALGVPGVPLIFRAGKTQRIVNRHGLHGFLLMQHVVGRSLAQCIKQVPLVFFRNLAAILATIHDHGLTHRDLKPANILIVKDPQALGGWSAVLIDFGIARAPSAMLPQDLTEIGYFYGSKEYASPEQLRCEVVDSQSDVFSLGVIIAQYLGVDVWRFSPGQLPFAVLDQMTIRLSQANANLLGRRSTEVTNLIAEMLDQDPAKRPSAKNVVARLEAAIGIALDAPANLGEVKANALIRTAKERVTITTTMEADSELRVSVLRDAKIWIVATIALSSALAILLILVALPKVNKSDNPLTALPKVNKSDNPPTELPKVNKSDNPPTTLLKVNKSDDPPTQTTNQPTTDVRNQVVPSVTGDAAISHLRCNDGQIEMNPGPEAICCWEGQTFNNKICKGKPSQCPSGRTPTVYGCTHNAIEVRRDAMLGHWMDSSGHGWVIDEIDGNLMVRGIINSETRTDIQSPKWVEDAIRFTWQGDVDETLRLNRSNPNSELIGEWMSTSDGYTQTDYFSRADSNGTQ